MSSPSNSPSSRNGKSGTILSDGEDNAFKQQLTDSKLLRKKAEEDAQLLANRIALLQQEEQKAMKKVEETKKKAQEIVILKNRNLMLAKQKAEVLSAI